jgi:hypothetical protein
MFVVRIDVCGMRSADGLAESKSQESRRTQNLRGVSRLQARYILIVSVVNEALRDGIQGIRLGNKSCLYTV